MYVMHILKIKLNQLCTYYIISERLIKDLYLKSYENSFILNTDTNFFNNHMLIRKSYINRPMISLYFICRDSEINRLILIQKNIFYYYNPSKFLLIVNEAYIIF